MFLVSLILIFLIIKVTGIKVWLFIFLIGQLTQVIQVILEYFNDFADYLGGYSELIGPVDGALYVDHNGLHFEYGVRNHSILFSLDNIIDVRFKTKEKVTRDVTFFRLLFLGIFAFAFKKERIKPVSHLFLTYNEGDFTTEIVFKTKRAGKIVSLLMKEKKQYFKLNDRQLNTTILK